MAIVHGADRKGLVQGNCNRTVPERELYGQVSVLENGHPITLLFQNKNSARQFADFVRLHISETGVGNGYNQYWLERSATVIGVDALPTRQAELNITYIHNMAADLCNARTCRHYSDKRVPEYVPTIGKKQGVIAFQFDREDLPPRTIPSAGDVARVVDHNELSGTARVCSIEAGIAFVTTEAGSLLLLRNGNIVEPNSSIRVPATCVMKVRDFGG